jgi:GH15 family glucan-1,4-alpha-glucosidase
MIVEVVLSTVALDRAIRLATHPGRPGNVTCWAHEHDKIYAQIMSRGWNTQKRAFTQHYGTDVLDASLPSRSGGEAALAPHTRGG